MREALAGLGRLPATSVVASIIGVATFALAQPLLDLLGRNPEFFIARRFPGADIALLAVGLLVVPAVAAAPILALRWLGPVWSGTAHLVVLAVVAAAAASAILVTLGLGSRPTWAFAAVAGLAGLGISLAYAAFSSARTALGYLGLAPVVVGLWFVLATPVSQVLFAGPAEVPEAVSVETRVPVVMVVYDEFPLASMIHPDGSLDTEHFPNFADLAADGVWYRNAMGVRQQTEEAIPALVTGREISEGSIPTTADHPFTLFSLLSADYDVRAVENVTELCPPFICSNESRPVEPPARRWRAVLGDVAVVYGHVLLPEDLAAALPSVEQGWGGFDTPRSGDFDLIARFVDTVADDRRREVERFIDILGEGVSEQPPLRFGHLLYPHHPWDLTTEGRVHGATAAPGRDGVGWGDDEFLVAQGLQRHLIQTQWADTVLGRITERLKQEGTYDDTLLLVAADHGIAIRPGVNHQRVIDASTIGSIAAIPLFVKYPEGTSAAPPVGTVDDVRATTLDLVPTIAQVLGVTIPWEVDGVSLLDTTGGREDRVTAMLGSEGEIFLPPGIDALLEEAADQEVWFPDGDAYGLTPPGWGALSSRDSVSGDDDPGLAIVLSQEEELADFTAGGDPIPSFLSGTVSPPGGAEGVEILAVTVGGRVAAVTRSFEPENGTARWEAMIEPALIDSGLPVEVWLVTGSVSDPVYAR